MASATAATTRPPHWQAATLLPIINAMEANIKHRLFLSGSPSYPRRSNHRQHPFRFLFLPAEIRQTVYEQVWGTELDYYFSIYICLPSVNIRRLHDKGPRSSR